MSDYFRYWKRRSSPVLLSTVVGGAMLVLLLVGGMITRLTVSEAESTNWAINLLKYDVASKLVASLIVGTLAWLARQWWSGFSLWIPDPSTFFVLGDHNRPVIRREQLGDLFQTSGTTTLLKEDGWQMEGGGSLSRCSITG